MRVVHATLRGALLTAALVGISQVDAQPAAAREGRTQTQGQRWQREGGGRNRRGGMNMQVAEEFVGRLQRENPEQFERLMELRQNDPQAFRQELMKLIAARRGHGRPGGRERVPPEEARCRELTRRYQETEDPAERERIRSELAGAISEAFDVRVRTYREHLARLEEQIGKLRERIERMEANRERICEIRLEELTRPPELEWDGGLGRGR